MKEYIVDTEDFDSHDALVGYIKYNYKELIRCKECKHRPTINGEYENGFSLEFPDYKCPCQCDDGYYSWMPKDDWFCGNGERKEI